MKAITFGTLLAQEGQSEALLKTIQEHMDLLKKQEGFVEGYVARDKGNNHKFLVISIWQNQEAQQAAVSKLTGDPLATKGFFELMQLLNGQPDFGNYLVEDICR
ncbi:Antibiotic biosynthesis monooxygenase [Desulfotomaculum nigrificans CO-1-SRB]|uniref:Antibiotic biosynthesis monooxygenase n=1 Tax=Desulfotomaculum nigrificans (strain DSM 14880 / VKM B-2319 / CO-1-SRB) TaxID=868595 RepID=F6B7K0_DESCC|nr:antibiotic biosynthesis monooxygenase family protein [Desulfotomaculum nigrificans]AEF94554.1 Antibiotic biosynthesis monooxygenase [Desulfotomaculum nigrificans CO-1-SRB]